MTGLDDDLVALVTGGAGGIGAAICGRLAAEGYRVVVADRDAAAAEDVVLSLGTGADRAIAVQADVTDPGENRAMVARAVDRYGRLDLLVLCAGVRAYQPPEAPLDLAGYQRTLAVNVDGVVFGIDAALPVLAEYGGSVLVVASVAALAPQLGNPLYALTKSAVVGYVRALAPSFGQRGMRVNALCPSVTDTPFLGVSRRFLRRQGFPLLRPEEVAGAALTLLGAGGNGEAWELVAGWPARRHEYTGVPATLGPDGSEVRLRPILPEE